MECLFCDVQRSQATPVGGAIYEDELVYAYHYTPAEMPAYLGSLVILTKRHAATFADLSDAEAQAVGLLTTRLSRALRECAGAERCYVVFYGEVVPHLHVFVTARYPGMPQQYWRENASAWPDAPRGGVQNISSLCDRVRAALYVMGAIPLVHPDEQ